MNRIIVKIFALTILFSACSKDKRLNKRVNKELEGTWKSILNNNVVETLWTFNANKKASGTITTNTGTVVIKGIWLPPNSAFSKTINDNYTISENGTLLRIENGYTYTIIEVTETSIVWSYTSNYKKTIEKLIKQ